ncbi:hypothetical protein C8T65DRAFT_522840, partial [Cerioporus squamosus]
MHNLFLGELREHCIKIWDLKNAESRHKPKRLQAHTPDQQRDILRRIREGVSQLSSNIIKRARRDYLEAVIELNGIAVPNNKQTKAGFAEALVAWVQAVPGGFPSFQLPSPMPTSTTHFRLPTAEPDSPRGILTNPVLLQLRQDIRGVFLPSWLEKPPSNLGEAKHGKLKADHWRTLCTVFMVITLIRLWGTTAALPDEAIALENYMHLVAAVDLATRRSMSPARANSYDQHMLSYLQGLRTFYGADLKPNQHLALHLRECLLLFGPVHGWWAFPFERYNGLLQRLKTNHKPADMPKTFIRYFYLGAALRWVMDSFQWPKIPEYQEMVDAFRTAFSGPRTGTYATDQSVFSTISDDDISATSQSRGGVDYTLPDQLYRSLLKLVNRTSEVAFGSFHVGAIDGNPYLSPTATAIRKTDHGGVSYASATTGKRDSFILFSKEVDGSRQAVAGQISEIFTHTRQNGPTVVEETFFLVDEFKALSPQHAALDPYRKFPDVPTWLCYNEFSTNQHLLRAQDIISHFAALIYTPSDIGTECIVVRSLDR